jgi:hypothetical protein
VDEVSLGQVLLQVLHSIFTRQVSKFYRPTSKLTVYQRGTFNMVIKICNKLPPFIKNASDSSKTLKTLLKKFLYSHLFHTLEEYFNHSST